ncbi:aryl-alcohol dehydrogenase-like predicted oxidoreductase [Bradyrhizobium ottawaense]
MAWQFAKALYRSDANSWARFVSMQCHLNLLYREEEREMLPLCRDEGVGVIAFSPLARGRLTRPWTERSSRSDTDNVTAQFYGHAEAADRSIVDAVTDIAMERRVAPAHVALAWVAAKPGVTAPIVGATKTQHLDDAITALGLKLTSDEIGRLEERYVPHTVVGLK